MQWHPLFFLTSPFSISQGEVNAFHNLDRKLFRCLVVNLGRDTVQSIQVMSLWLWFERIGICRKLVDTLLSLPLGVTGALADEAAIILRCIEQDQIPAPLENFEIHITRSFAKTGVSLRFLHHHRQIVVDGVTQGISEVCSRAFKDIMNRSAGNPRDDMWFQPEPAQEESSYHVSEMDDIWEEFKNNAFSLPPKEEFVYPVHEFPVYQSNPEFVPRMVHSSTTRNSSAGSGMSNIRQNFMPNNAASRMHYNNIPRNFGPNAASGMHNNITHTFVPNAASGISNNFPHTFVPNAASGIRNNFPQDFVPNEARRMHNNIPQNFAPNAARAMGPTWIPPHLHRQQQQQYYTNMIQNNGPDNFSHAYEEDNDISYQHRQHVISNQLSDLFGNMNLAAFNELEMERDLVPEDDRTLFLTFSKGYPISENEVREYFTRRYGKCFDDIHMQEVGSDEQVLFARMVVKAESIIYVILGGRPKAKFTINGKHVWARKYVRKGKEKEKGASSSQQQPSSPRSGTSMSG